MVAARVAFIPTSQSASLRARAAASRGCIASSSRSESNASRMAFCVIELNQARLTGFSRAAFGAVSRISLKINSPSRPASQALMIASTSGRFISAWSDFSVLPARVSRAWYLKCSGRIGRSS